MPRHVYVMAVESGTGKSAVVLGLADLLSRRAARLALFRPLVAAADPPDPDIELVRRRYGSRRPTRSPTPSPQTTCTTWTGGAGTTGSSTGCWTGARP